MDSSLQSANLTEDELKTSLATDQEGAEEAEHHIHLPNPSLWPLMLSVAIAVVFIGLLFIPDNPWLSIVAAPFVLVGILGWALEDPMAAPKVEYIQEREPADVQSRFRIGQDVVDKDGNWLGTVQARFGNRYILVERGGLFVKAYYVPQNLTSDSVQNNVVRLTVNEAYLLNRDLDNLPDDLYEEQPEPGVPQIKGIPMFARGPLSPAETGHYNYGPNYPGINTDASGSYHREEVVPAPQRYVADRRRLYATDRTVPPRAISPD